MERFYNDDSENNDDPYFGYDEDGEDFGEMDGEIAYIGGMVHRDDLMQAMQLDIAEIKLIQKILKKSISLAEKSWFWSFKSHSKKLAIIEEIYHKLMDIMESRNSTRKEKEE